MNEHDGFEVFIHIKDHEPPHVHVLKDDADLRVWLDMDREAELRGTMKRSDVRKALLLVAERRAQYLARWNEIKPRLK